MKKSGARRAAFTVLFLVTIVGAIGCNDAKRQIEEFTYVPVRELVKKNTECGAYPCEVTVDDRKWSLKKLELKAGTEWTIPRLGKTHRYEDEGPVVALRPVPLTARDLDDKRRGQLVIGYAPVDDFVVLFSEDVPCPDRATCSSQAILDGKRALLSSVFTICYRPTASDFRGAQRVESVTPKVIEAAWDVQRKRLPADGTEFVNEKNDDGVGYGAAFGGKTVVRIREGELFGAGRHITTARDGLSDLSTVQGCVNSYYVKRVADLTAPLFDRYVQDAARKSDEAKSEKEALEAVTVPK